MRRQAPGLTLGLICAFFSVGKPAQSQPEVKIQFEVASLRAVGPLMKGDWPKGAPIPTAGLMSGGPGTADPGHVRYTRVHMMAILKEAFGLPRDQFLGPSWLFPPYNDATDERYDLQATVPAGTTKEGIAIMLQNLLKERLRLAYHYEKRDFDSYALVTGKGGPRLSSARPAIPTSSPESGVIRSTVPMDGNGFPVVPAGRPELLASRSDGRMHVIARIEPMAKLAEYIFYELMDPFGGTSPRVVDKTGLTGVYDFTLEYPAFRNTPPDEPTIDPIKALQSALEKQLGLSLQKSKTALDVVVIDHIDTVPSEN